MRIGAGGWCSVVAGATAAGVVARPSGREVAGAKRQRSGSQLRQPRRNKETTTRQWDGSSNRGSNQPQCTTN